LPPLLKSLRPLDRFLRVEANSTALLLIAAVAALVWANWPGTHSYASVWETPVTAAHTLRFWVNDALMTLFFLVVGLEIRAELHEGILSDRRMAVLPFVAALGGILLPALIFVCVNPESPLRRGWAIPTATDIAFAVGVLTLLGKRVPRPLRVLLLTLAIVDDIAAVLVIALYYAQGFSTLGILIALGAIGAVVLCQRGGLQSPAWYLLPGVLLWYGLARAGIEPTLAGVILGLMTPVRSRHDAADSPVTRVKERVHPWVAFAVMPLFALANAGIDFGGLTTFSPSVYRVGIGIVLGLVLGKPLGIVLVTILCLKLKLCTLPGVLGWRHLLVLGCLGGIGFTMSIFIANLALPTPEVIALAKAAVLLGSLAAAACGLLLGRLLL